MSIFLAASGSSITMVSVISSFRLGGSRPVSAKCAFDLLYQIRLSELPARQIDGHSQAGRDGKVCCRHFASRHAPSGPNARSDDQARLFGNRNEFARMDQTPSRMIPSHESLESAKFLRSQR